MYQALYRKWRPKVFDDVVGQSHITETLKNQVSSGRLSHAYLFIGTRGTGKTTCAKILAKAVNCENPQNGNPCNQCAACLGIDAGSVMDVVEMDAASNNGVDSVRALRDEAVFSPAAVKKRVYIVDEVHMLSTSAFNALLKILEEPPEHLMFILATTELHKVPATILSRCQRHSFKRLDMASIMGRLRYVAREEQIDLDEGAAELIARLSEGGMRDALSLLDQCSGREHIDTEAVYSAMGLAGRQNTARLVGLIAANDTSATLSLFQELWQEGKDPATLLGELSSLMRDILMIKVAPNNANELLSSGYDGETLNHLASVFTAGVLIDGIRNIQDTLGAMRLGQAKTLCELCLVSLCEPDLGDGLPAVRQRVARLENALRSGQTGPMPVGQLSASTVSVPVPGEQVPPHPQNRSPKPEGFAVPPVQEEPELPPLPEEAPPKTRDTLPLEANEAPLSAADIFPAPAEHPKEAPSRRDIPAPPPDLAPASGVAPGGMEALMGLLASRLPRGIYAMLSDTSKTFFRLEGDTLTVEVEPGFAMNNIDRPDVIGRIAATAGEVMGRPIQVKIAALGAGKSQEASGKEEVLRKLESLKQYDIVTFI